MGTLNYTITEYGPDGQTVMSTDDNGSLAYTTSTSASFVDDGATDITLGNGEVFYCVADVAMWIRFGGNAAAVGTGFCLAAGTPYHFHCTTPGKVSAIDVA